MGMTGSFAVLALGLAALAAALITREVYRFCLRHAIIDTPNERSSHTTPTPRGAGVSIAVVWLLSVALLGGSSLLAPRVAWALAGGGLLMAIVGWWDDRGDLLARTRLGFQIAAAAWVVGWLGGVPSLAFGNLEVRVGWAGSLLAVLGLVWMINLYNFMDGIDGIAGVEAFTAGAAIALILWDANSRGLAIAAGTLAAAAAGFLVWNWPPARIFMGDVGSCLLGFAFGAIIVAAERTGAAAALVLVVPLLVFICDATVTLVRRLLRGERVYQAHRSHLYQRLVQRGWRHGQVSGLVAVVNLALGGIAVFLHRHPGWVPLGVASATVGVSILGLALDWISRRGCSSPRPVPSTRPSGVNVLHE